MKNYILKNGASPISTHFNFGDVIDYQAKIEPSYYFLALNEEFPEIIAFHENFKCLDLLNQLVEKYQIDTANIWKYHSYSRQDERVVLDIFMVQIRQDLLVFCDADDNEVKIFYSNRIAEALINEIVQMVRACVREELIKADSKIFLLYENKGLYLQDFKVKKYPISLSDNYNEDFESIHELIIERLNTPDDKGIVLLHGLPGTGKTSYIRYLTSLINKKMIYIPPEFAYRIASPDFLPLLIDNPNSILIIEDAENVIESRESGRNMSVSNLLNLADGLLSDCLNIQIVCTFNTHISKIDKALLRKGRLIASYEFKSLSIDKAQNLSDKLGFDTLVETPMSLTDVYNQRERDFAEMEKIKIGF
jgi:ATPase family associated with various cellular activities (AAA)